MVAAEVVVDRVHFRSLDTDRRLRVEQSRVLGESIDLHQILVDRTGDTWVC